MISINSVFQKSSYKLRGIAAEDYVAQQLKLQGFSIAAQNYQKQYGEIDIIAQKKDLVLFVEVKCRKNPLFDVSSVITHSKKKKIIAVAKQYIAQHKLDEHTFRFDVAFVVDTSRAAAAEKKYFQQSNNNAGLSLEYLEDAFQSDE